MQTVEILSIEGSQAVKLPDAFRFDESTVSIRKEGDAVVLEPIKPKSWPPGFFEKIRIDDPAFGRPQQGDLPPIAPIDTVP